MLLESVYEGAPAILTGRYLTTVNEFTDQVPALRTSVLKEACKRLLDLGPLTGVTKLLVEEDKGAILGGALCLATGLPLAIARWYPYDLRAVGAGKPVVQVPLESEYFTGQLFVNGLAAGDRVLIIDDTISTGGTLISLIGAVHKMGAQVTDVRVVVEKPENGGINRISNAFDIQIKSVLSITIDEGTRRTRVLEPSDDRKGADHVSRNIIDSIGNTELCRLDNIAEIGSAEIFAKCEFQNPTGSHKDRVFSYILTELERQGSITPGMTLIECSTGNGGAALAQVGRMRGYKIVIVMPRGMTMERKTQIRSFGASIIETDPQGFLDATESFARQYVEENPGSYFLDQSANELNWQAWRICGGEIVEFFKERDRVVDVFVCSLGTGGTFSGIADQLKSAFPQVHTIAVEVDRSAPLYAQRHGGTFKHHNHNLIGLGPGKIPPNVRQDLIDEVRIAPGEQGWAMMKTLIEAEQLFAGPTAGTNVYVARQVAAEVGTGKTVVTVLFDSAWKYFSVWDGNYADYPTSGRPQTESSAS